MSIIASFLMIAVTALLIKLYCFATKNSRLIDLPNERSLHANPTIRGGGLVFMGLWLTLVLLLSTSKNYRFEESWIILVSVFLIAAVSFLDDVFNLSIKVRLLVQVMVAALIAMSIVPLKLEFIYFSIQNPFLIKAIIFLLVLGAINHFNFMDGLDGFSATQAIFLLAVYGFIFKTNNGLVYEKITFSLMLMVFAFLLFNFPPAKVFMGDVGSASLGLIIFLMALIGQKNFQVPILYWIMLNGIFLFDSSITLLRRLMKGEKWYAPHKMHAYQRLRQKGIKIRTILMGQFIANCVFLILVALLHQNQSFKFMIINIELLILVFLYYFIEQAHPMKKNYRI